MQPAPADLAAAEAAGIADPLRKAFAAKVIGMDAGVGRLLKTLEETGQAGSTLVIFMTDHGGDAAYGGSNAPAAGRQGDAVRRRGSACRASSAGRAW